MNIFVAFELDDSVKKIIQNNLKKHNLYFSNLVFNKTADKNYLKCEIVFGNIPPNWILQSSKLKWIQLESTGFGEYSKIRKNFLKNDVIITNLKSFSASQVAQTALAGVLSLYRGTDLFPLLKKEKKWVGDPIRKKLEILNNKKVLFFGKGSINKEFSKYLNPFDCKCSFIDSHSTKEFILNKLKLAEIIICALPGTKRTRMLFNKTMLNSLSKHSILVNIGRGDLIDENHLIEKLKNKTIKGAVLDVTSEEPLHENSKLWNCPNLILTQHTGGGYTNEIQDKVYFFLDNFNRYSKNKSLLNIINPSKGY